MIRMKVSLFQMKLQNIHMRIEEAGEPTQPAAIGLCIDGMRLESTDENWQPAYTEEGIDQKPILYKLASMENLSIYCDPLEGPDVDRLKESEFIAYMRDMVRPVRVTLGQLV